MGSTSDEDDDFWAFEGQDDRVDEHSFERKCMFCGKDEPTAPSYGNIFCGVQCRLKHQQFYSPYVSHPNSHNLTNGIPYTIRRTYTPNVQDGRDHPSCSFCGKTDENVIDFQTLLKRGFLHSYFCKNAVCLDKYTKFFDHMQSPDPEAPHVIKEFGHAAEWYRQQCVVRMYKPYAIAQEEKEKKSLSELTEPDSSSSSCSVVQ